MIIKPDFHKHIEDYLHKNTDIDTIDILYLQNPYNRQIFAHHIAERLLNDDRYKSHINNILPADILKYNALLHLHAAFIGKYLTHMFIDSHR